MFSEGHRHIEIARIRRLLIFECVHAAIARRNSETAIVGHDLDTWWKFHCWQRQLRCLLT